MRLREWQLLVIGAAPVRNAPTRAEADAAFAAWREQETKRHAG